MVTTTGVKPDALSRSRLRLEVETSWGIAFLNATIWGLVDGDSIPFSFERTPLGSSGLHRVPRNADVMAKAPWWKQFYCACLRTANVYVKIFDGSITSSSINLQGTIECARTSQLISAQVAEVVLQNLTDQPLHWLTKTRIWFWWIPKPGLWVCISAACHFLKDFLLVPRRVFNEKVSVRFQVKTRSKKKCERAIDGKIEIIPRHLKFQDMHARCVKLKSTRGLFIDKFTAHQMVT